MKILTFLLSITLLGFVDSTHSEVKSLDVDKTCSSLVNYIENSKPGFWLSMIMSLSAPESLDQIKYLDIEVQKTCGKFKLGKLSKDDATIRLTEIVTEFEYGKKEAMAKDIKSTLLIYVNVFLIILGAVSTVVGIMVGIKKYNSHR